MKKLLLILTAFLVICPNSYATESANIALLSKKGFFDHPQESCFISPCEEVKRTLYSHLKYANSYDLEGLKSLYSDNYISSDGLNKKIYFDLIRKTWASYPDIKYKINIKNIETDGNIAVAQVNESATATTNLTSSVLKEKGILQSTSNSVYYLEKVNGEWQVTSDYILYERTFLLYGSAKDMAISLTSPSQIAANEQYSTSLKIDSPEDTIIIASIGQEKITYPQEVAPEVFRKLPDSGVLERVFRANDKNINEYAVASFGVTKAELKKATEIKISVTGLGFVMSRVNVIPQNNFIKVEKDEKTE